MPVHPAMRQVNTRMWLSELGDTLHRPATLARSARSAETDTFPDGLIPCSSITGTAACGRPTCTRTLTISAARCAFLENHDEARVVTAFWDTRMHGAAAIIALLAPGLRFVRDGQVTGRRLRASNHLRRHAVEPVDREIETFYARLLACMRYGEARDGRCRLLDAQPGWSGNSSCEQFVAFTWDKDARRMLVAVNYAPQRGQCRLPLPYPELAAREVRLRDPIDSTITYSRSGDELVREGLYLDVPPWRHHVFALEA